MADIASTSSANGAHAATHDTIALPDHIQRLFIDAEAHLVPQLKEAAADAGTLDDAESQLHEGIARLEGVLSNWGIDVVDLGRNAHERMAWDKVLADGRRRLTQLRQSATKALMEAQQLAQRRQQQQRGAAQDARSALFADMTTSEEERKRRREGRTDNQTADEQLMTASSDVTAALQRAVQLMSTELEKSSYSAQLLDESSVSVQQATIQYTSFTALVASSRKLIASMERADMVDAIMLLCSLLFFLGCIVYILKVRIWDKGIGIISFAFRIFGLTSSRSVADVQEKLALAKQAALQSASSSSASASRASVASAIQASSSAAAAAAAASSAAVTASAIAAAEAYASSFTSSSLASEASAASALSAAQTSASLSSSSQSLEVTQSLPTDTTIYAEEVLETPTETEVPSAITTPPAEGTERLSHQPHDEL